MALTDRDRTLLRRCLANEPGSWKDFVDRYLGLFIHVVNHTAHARTVTLTKEDTDDLCAEIFLQILAEDAAVLRRFRGKSSLATYLAVVARRIVAKEISRRRKAEAMGHVQAHGNANAVRSAAVAANQQRIEDQDEIRRLLAELPATDAEVVRQFHLEGKSYREISSQLGIPENSIGPTLSRARERLREGQVNS